MCAKEQSALYEPGNNVLVAVIDDERVPQSINLPRPFAHFLYVFLHAFLRAFLLLKHMLMSSFATRICCEFRLRSAVKKGFTFQVVYELAGNACGI